MKHKKILTLLFSLWSLMLFAQTEVPRQEVISSASGLFSNSSGSIYFTIGECLTSTLRSNDLALTQGFHQTFLSISDIYTIGDLDFEITVFPNPATDFITIKVEKLQDLDYIIYNMYGVVMEKKKIVETESDVSFKTLPPSIYIIKVLQNDKEIRTFKIIKR